MNDSWLLILKTEDGSTEERVCTALDSTTRVNCSFLVLNDHVDKPNSFRFLENGLLESTNTSTGMFETMPMRIVKSDFKNALKITPPWVTKKPLPDIPLRNQNGIMRLVSKKIKSVLAKNIMPK